MDAEDSAGPLLEINRMALMEECTMLLAWSTLEAARCVVACDFNRWFALYGLV